MGLIEIENAVASFSKNELILFRDWFEKFDSDLWDKQIEKDILNGSFDEMAKNAISEFESKNITEL